MLPDFVCSVIVPVLDVCVGNCDANVPDAGVHVYDPVPAATFAVNVAFPTAIVRTWENAEEAASIVMAFPEPIVKSPLQDADDALGIVVSVRDFPDIDADPGEYVPLATNTDAAQLIVFVPSAL